VEAKLLTYVVATQDMTDEEILGKKIKEVYETKASIDDDILGLGKPQYFSIVIELADDTRFELGVHDIRIWDSPEKLIPSKGTNWADEHKLEYKDKRIARIIRKDPGENFDGSLTIVLDNNVLIEHQCANGDQLFIDYFEKRD
jgi:hypothetical protein